MTRDDIIRMAREAGWSGIYTQWREPDGSPDWTLVKESLTVPVTMDQIERFAALVAAAERNKAVENAERYRHAMLEAMYLLDQPEPRPHAAYSELLLALNPAIDNRKKSFIDATRSET